MIPGDFTYKRPKNKAEALTLLAEGGVDARPLAGGHSLIPMMKLRMASPSMLVDITALDDLKGIDIGATEIGIGAATTQHALIESHQLAQACPIIRETAMLIADPQIRYCGTLGGNVGNGDPGNDMPGLMQCLDADYVLESADGARRVSSRDFYEGAYITLLNPGEIITKVVIPRPVDGHGYAYEKLKRKVGDYATAAAAVTVETVGGKVRNASVALTNLGDTPLYAEDAVEKLIGTSLHDSDIRAAAEAAQAITNPTPDGRGSAEYRAAMAGVMVGRALRKARDRAGEAAPRPVAQIQESPRKDNDKSGGMFGWLKR